MSEDTAPSIEELLTRISGKDRKTVIATGQCAMCEDPDMDFREAIDRAEYAISGMCQKCQDVAFAEPSDEED